MWFFNVKPDQACPLVITNFPTDIKIIFFNVKFAEYVFRIFYAYNVDNILIAVSNTATVNKLVLIQILNNYLSLCNLVYRYSNLDFRNTLNS
jgi:hypothetical protein